ncbi:MAG: alpha-mannosidase [Clostridia bacterium]|nr:alpha-mannosidase [Clostridia bacterium]
MLIPHSVFDKLNLICAEYEKLRFADVTELPCERFDTYAHFRTLPAGEYTPIRRGDPFGDDDLTMWVRSVFIMPQELDGKPVFVHYENTGMEALLEVDGVHLGGLDSNHHFVRITPCAAGGRQHVLGIESYSGRTLQGVHIHDVPGADAATVVTKNCRRFAGVFLSVENPVVTQLVFDLRTLLQQYSIFEDHHFRKARLANCLQGVFTDLYALPEEHTPEEYMPGVQKAIQRMRPLLQDHNGPSAPECITMGHSHLDTAWRWTLEETKRKCGRTYSSMVNLLDQYPDFCFIQSSPYHAELTKDNYPDVFERILYHYRRGKWEPNGAMYIEPDCNLTSGESLARQLLIGQRTTRELFDGYTADTLWLPDTFGYSAALPQLLRLAHVKYFCTTKLYWNETNRFPYDTFYWKGLDGECRVLAHFHKVHFHPDPATLDSFWKAIVQHKDVQNAFLAPFGYGDGGGGPMHEMIEEALRLRDLEGTPKTRFGTVSECMTQLEKGSDAIPEYCGELYLEVHRGTLTSLAKTKKLHRRAEQNLHHAEYLCAVAMKAGMPYPADAFTRLWKTLLVNEFHDILPGTSIAPVNDRCHQELQQIIDETDEWIKTAAAVLTQPAGGYTLFNTLGWDRTSLLKLPIPIGMQAEGAVTQNVQDVFGHAYQLCAGLRIPAGGSAYVTAVPEQEAERSASPFRYDGRTLTTPFAVITFEKDGTIASWIDRPSGRQLVREGGRFNGFSVGEDAPTYWDNWDINYDQKFKRHADNRLLSRTVTADGPLSLRIESCYLVAEASRITQQMVVYATTPQVDFETIVDWKERHVLLKTVFDTSIFSDTVRNETQFGFLDRPTTENNSEQRAKFEVSQHKWSDLSDSGFGVALLNDCKYGIAARGGSLSLSLLKSGTHPDPRADEGRHTFIYSLLPHNGPFSVETVVRPAYELNYAPIVQAGARPAAQTVPLCVDCADVIVETLKKAEDENAWIVRCYEAGRMGTFANFRFDPCVRTVEEVDLLEEKTADVPLEEGKATVYFKPFEIKTFKLAF